ncbi:MAG: cell division protein FtsQ/DivIB [Sedimentibacter sp.]
MPKEKETKRPKKKKKKKKFRKLFVSTAAFITAAVVIIFCIYYTYFETDYFDIVEVHVTGNSTYNKDYIIDKSQIAVGEKIFDIDRDRVKSILEDEVYVENARVVLELPNRILIELTERQEKYQIIYNQQYIVTDKNGIVLRTDTKINELLTIESLTDIIYNVGESIQITGVENVKAIFQTIDYIDNEFGSDTVKSLKIDLNNIFLLETEYGTFIKIKLDEDIKYQIVFAMKIINERLNNNLDVTSGLIDFTKGDSPVYREDFKMEEYDE